LLVTVDPRTRVVLYRGRFRGAVFDWCQGFLAPDHFSLAQRVHEEKYQIRHPSIPQGYRKPRNEGSASTNPCNSRSSLAPTVRRTATTSEFVRQDLTQQRWAVGPHELPRPTAGSRRRNATQVAPAPFPNSARRVETPPSAQARYLEHQRT